MPFTKTILTAKQQHTAQERSVADTVYAKWLELEPRCDTGRDEVLRLRHDGPMIRWDGTGEDIGKWVQVSFLNKPGRALRLVAACGETSTRRDMALLLVRSIRDVLDAGASKVYFYLKKQDQQAAPEWFSVLGAIVGLFDSVFVVTDLSNDDEKHWEVRLK